MTMLQYRRFLIRHIYPSDILGFMICIIATTELGQSFNMPGSHAATLPLGNVESGTLQPKSSSISFGPLALLAILHNPRAAASAARLYGQSSYEAFRWPHTSKISRLGIAISTKPLIQ
jgi:hypothetical protein